MDEPDRELVWEITKKSDSQGGIQIRRKPEEKITNFIDYYNTCMFTPMKWKFEGKKYRNEFT